MKLKIITSATIALFAFSVTAQANFLQDNIKKYKECEIVAQFALQTTYRKNVQGMSKKEILSQFEHGVSDNPMKDYYKGIIAEAYDVEWDTSRDAYLDIIEGCVRKEVMY